MKEKNKDVFPQDFLWGAASAAYQIEGALDEGGRTPSIWDYFVKKPEHTFADSKGDLAADFYHRYEEDIQLMKEMGLKAFRFSISWSRIIPDIDGTVNPEGIDFYRKMIHLLKSNEIEPIITLYHWDLPEYLQAAYKGWESRKTVEAFVEYANVLFDEFGSDVNYWVTMNEQNMFISLGYLTASHPLGIKDPIRMFKANHHANLANALAIASYRQKKYSGMIGPSFAYSTAYALNNDPDNNLALDIAEDFTNNLWTDIYCWGKYPQRIIRILTDLGIYEEMMEEGDTAILKEGKPDFLGMNYYQSTSFQKYTPEKKQGIANLFSVAENPFLEKTQWEWTIDPEGLRIGLNRLTNKYQLPILITENGLGAYDTVEEGQVHDPYRITYLDRHIEAQKAAIKDGVDLIGYCVWSFTDLLSWLNGYDKRYGLVYIDRENTEEPLKRIKKDSFYWYKKVIAANGNKNSGERE